MTTRLIALLATSLCFFGQAHANGTAASSPPPDPSAALTSALAEVHAAGTAIVTDAGASFELERELNTLGDAWLQAASDLMTSPGTVLGRQVRAAAEIPSPALLVTDHGSVVIMRGPSPTINYQPAGTNQFEALRGEIKALLQEQLMDRSPQEVLEAVTRKHLIDALHQTGADVSDPQRALDEAIAKQERGELPAGRVAAFERLLQPYLHRNGPVSQLLGKMAELPASNAADDGFIALRTNDGPLLQNGQPVKVRLSPQSGLVAYALHENNAPARVEPNTVLSVALKLPDVTPKAMLEAVTNLAADCRARAAEVQSKVSNRLQQQRTLIQRLRPALQQHPR